MESSKEHNRELHSSIDSELANPGAEIAEWASVHQVFATEVLREHILDYSIRKKSGGLLSGSNLASARLVSRLWLESVSQTLRQSYEPLFSLTLDKNNSLSGNPLVDADGKLLERFAAVLKNRIDNQPFPTFRLKLLEEFFQLENNDSFYNFLLQCGQGLVELELQVPRNGGSLPCIFSNLDLPLLRKLIVAFSHKDVTVQENAVRLERSSCNIILLLQSLLDKNHTLKELIFPFLSCRNLVPAGFQYVALPTSLTKLSVECTHNAHDLEILTRNSLPNLSSLVLMVSSITYPDGLLTRIFHRFKQTLEHLEIQGVLCNCTGPSTTPINNLVQFPVMEKLKELNNACYFWRLESSNCDVSQCFPKLQKLTLGFQTRAALHKWTTRSTFKNVTYLLLQLIDDTVPSPPTHRGFHQPITLEDMQRVHLTFPNVHHLELNLTAEQTCGLKYMFMEMKQLNSLTISVSETGFINNSDLWDSIFIGVPQEIVAVVKANPDFRKHINFESAELPSIRMLTGLAHLALEVDKRKYQAAPVPPNPPRNLISALTFDYAFMRMANLASLKLCKEFKVDDATMNAWKAAKDGRTISFC